MARIIYMGTPDYARRILELIASHPHTLLVVTKPDMLVGRHRRLTPSPVATWALERGMEVLRPQRLLDIKDRVQSFQPDYILTAAFGRILRPWLLAAPRFGAYNLHASLLPRWRGPNPIAWAIRAGDAVTGVTLMEMDAGVDTGPIVSKTEMAISDDDTTATLTEKLAQAAGRLWIASLAPVSGQGRLLAAPQPLEGVTTAPKFSSHDGCLDWTRPATLLDAEIRSMTPEPGPYAFVNEQRIKIVQAQPLSANSGEDPGRITVDGEDWRVACGVGMLRITTIQPAGGRAMRPGDYMRGRPPQQIWRFS